MRYSPMFIALSSVHPAAPYTAHVPPYRLARYRFQLLAPTAHHTSFLRFLHGIRSIYLIASEIPSSHTHPSAAVRVAVAARRRDAHAPHRNRSSRNIIVLLLVRPWSLPASHRTAVRAFRHFYCSPRFPRDPTPPSACFPVPLSLALFYVLSCPYMHVCLLTIPRVRYGISSTRLCVSFERPSQSFSLLLSCFCLLAF
ncbi:hypothetical protein GY45DRAFT_459254 [Cubamyces sp. BRFM 1775]|nr:hypothetical protein GY45DRAFT_459254 [Cubamyces sp. BRFM 1775]